MKTTARLAERIRQRSHPLRDAGDLDPLLERIGDARCVLLGEASHGTSEYYTWRARISERLIREKGFSFIAVEGDWPDCYEVNRYVVGLPGSAHSAREALGVFRRWPTWMWANEEVAELVEGLRRHNDGLPEGERIGFYGLDVYSLWESLEAVMEYLQREHPDAVEAAWRAYRCFEPYGGSAREYARATAFVPTSCEDEVVGMLSELLRGAAERPEDGSEARFAAEQNALVARNAEAYYRAMIRGGASSWNVRDRHMTETLGRILDRHGPDAKAIVWEHNTHVGDARYTGMADRGLLNVGQLVRERWGEEEVVLVGFGSHRGTVVAGARWGAPMERMLVPPAREGSWEDALHHAGGEDGLLVFSGSEVEEMLEERDHRAIGVVYDPGSERYGNYVPTVLSRRYDAFLYLDETRALRPPLPPWSGELEEPETFPSGE
jgi:erythromycin esterase-like protein